MEHIISNDVFEYELSVVDKQIVAMRQKKQDVPDELNERRENLQMMHNLLVIKGLRFTFDSCDYLIGMKI